MMISCIILYTFQLLFQSPYNDLYYEAVGNATVLDYFGVNANGGLIPLRAQWQYPDRNENVFVVSTLYILLFLIDD